jgi:hypothetical protein
LRDGYGEIEIAAEPAQGEFHNEKGRRGVWGIFSTGVLPKKTLLQKSLSGKTGNRSRFPFGGSERPVRTFSWRIFAQSGSLAGCEETAG